MIRGIRLRTRPRSPIHVLSGHRRPNQLPPHRVIPSALTDTDTSVSISPQGYKYQEARRRPSRAT
jgi:hypothetical protein